MPFSRAMPFDRSAAKVWLTRRAAQLHHHLWLMRAMTLGVRAVVLDGDSVFLVRHTYRPGWYLPGGAVDRGETAEAAVVRELLEEGGIRCTARPILHGFYQTGTSRDHVACYVVRAFEATGRKPDWEIAETGFFPLDALPEATTPATRARLAELTDGREVSERW